MTTSRTPNEALLDFLGPIQRALNIICVGRLVLAHEIGKPEPNPTYTVLLNNADLVPIKSHISGTLRISTGYRIEIVTSNGKRNRFECRVIEYWHAFHDRTGQELVTFHWTPEASGTARTHPHLHIGRTISGNGQFLPDRFHKLHIPTNPLPISSIVRFAIEELGVSVRPEFDRTTVLAELANRDD